MEPTEAGCLFRLVGSEIFDENDYQENYETHHDGPRNERVVSKRRGILPGEGLDFGFFQPSLQVSKSQFICSLFLYELF